MTTSNSANGRLQRFKPDRPFMEEVTAGKLNALIDAIEARTPQRGVGTLLRQDASGFSYSAGPGGTGGGGFVPGFRCTVVDDGGTQKVAIRPSVVGLDEARVPEDSGGTRIDAASPPYFTITGTQTLYLQIEIEPAVEAIPGTSPTVYRISDSSYTVVNDRVLVTTTQTDQWATINTATGAVTANHIVSWPLCQATNSGGAVTINHQYLLGPISGAWCHGRMVPIAPSYFSVGGYSGVS